MKTTKRLLGLILLLSLILGAIVMTSCTLRFSPAGDSDERSEEEATPPNIYVTGGDTNNIIINTGESPILPAASKALLSTVSLTANFVKASLVPGFLPDTKFSQSGSGVIYKLNKDLGEAYIITNYHVIYSDSSSTSNKISDDISLYLYGMEADKYKISAKFIGGSMQHDLAVLKVSASPTLISSLATAVTVGDSDGVAILDTVIAVGNPDSNGISATVGYVNVDSEEILVSISDSAAPTILRVMRIDNAINRGNSGGGLFNRKGELIGIVNAKNMSGDNMSYAISSNLAKFVADNILYYYSGTGSTGVMLPDLRLSLVAKELYVTYDENTGKALRRERVAVSEIARSSAAYGLLQVGDSINYITVDGVKYDVTRVFHASECLLNARAGSEIVYNVTRGDTTLDLTVKVTSGMLERIQ